MDIPRPDEARKRRLRRIIYSVLGLMAVVGLTVLLSRLEPAAPTVDRATVYMDTVKRGSMLRQVRGPGTLVPEKICWVSAATAGRRSARRKSSANGFKHRLVLSFSPAGVVHVDTMPVGFLFVCAGWRLENFEDLSCCAAARAPSTAPAPSSVPFKKSLRVILISLPSRVASFFEIFFISFSRWNQW